MEEVLVRSPLLSLPQLFLACVWKSIFRVREPAVVQSLAEQFLTGCRDLAGNPKGSAVTLFTNDNHVGNHTQETPDSAGDQWVVVHHERPDAEGRRPAGRG